MTTRFDAPERPRSERTTALSMLAVFLVGAAVISVIVVMVLARAVSSGWAPVLGGAVLAASWPLVSRAWQEIHGSPPRRFWRVPGWVWLGAGGTLICALLLA